MNVNFKLETVIHGEYSMLPGLLTWELITVFQMMMMVSKKGQRRGRETTGRGIKGGLPLYLPVVYNAFCALLGSQLSRCTTCSRLHASRPRRQRSCLL